MVNVRIASLALAVVLGVPGTVHGQRSTIPPLVITDVADCITVAMADALREGAYTPEIDGGWQIVVPLRGQPNADPGAQTLPPAEDADFVLDVRAVGNAAELPVLDPFSDFAIAASDGVVWYAQSSGYFWLRPSTVARECFRGVTGGRAIIG
jgi:hypothetical protein